MRKFFKIVGYIIGSIILILLGIIIWLQTPSGKNFVREKAIAFLKDKLKTEVYVGAINYRLPKMLELDNVLFKDQAKDTLLAAEKLRVDINMLALIRKKVVVQQIELVGLRAHIYRNAPDTNYNLTYVINAFVGTPKEPTAKDIKKANDTGSSLSFNVDKINLDNIHVRFDDITGGIKLALDLDQLRLSLKKLDPSKLDFGIKKLSVYGLRSSFMQDTSYLPPKVDTTPAPEFHIAAEEIQIDKSSFTYGDKLSKFLFDINLGSLLLKPKTVDIGKEFIDLKELKLANTTVKIWMGKTQKKKAVATADTSSSNWRVLLTEGNLQSVSFKMDDENSPRQKTGMDYMHLDAQNLNLNAEDLLYSSDTISGNIKHLAVKEQSGFDLRELHTQFAYHNKGTTLRNLLLQTDQTVLQDYLEIGYPSLDALKKNMQQMQLKINLQKCVVGVKDILIFMPSMAQYDALRTNKNGHLRLDAIVQGTLGNLAINKLAFSGLGHSEVALDGKITGMPDANKIAYDLNLKKLQSARNDIISFLPKSVADQIRLPDVFAVTGQVSGTVKDYKMQLMLVSTDGKAYVKGSVLMSPGKNREQYDLYLRTEALNLGRILKQEENLGKISSNFSIKGRSFDIKDMTASLNGAVQSATVKGYTYTGIKLDGNVAAEKGNLTLFSTDKNAKLTLHANADFQKNDPAVVADLDIDSMDLQALKFVTNDCRMSSKIHLDAPVLNADYPRAALVVDQLIMVVDSNRYTQDSLYIVSEPTDSNQHIVADFRVLQAEVNGHMPLTRIGDVIQEHLDRHYMVHETVKKDKGKKQQVKPKSNVPANYDLSLFAKIEDGPLLHTFLPDLRYIDTVKIKGRLDPSSMTVNASLRRLVYGGNYIRGVKADISEADSALNYNVFVERYAQKQIRLLNTTLDGIIRSNEITANLNTQDTGKKDRFALAASMHQQGNDRVIELGNRLLLNYKEWTVQTPNSIVLGTNGFYVQNFKIVHDDESIDVNSKTAIYNAPLTIAIHNFHLSDVTSIISNPDTLLADGILSGNISLEQITPSTMVVADLKIQNLAILRDTIGDLTATATNTDNNSINTNIAISGNENDIQLSGLYHMVPVNGNNLDMKLALNAVSLKSLEPLAMQQIRNSSGFLRGNLNITGTPSKPVMLGEVHTENLETTISTLNADFHMPGEKIAFTEDGINFQNFKILDSAGNAFTIDGYIYTNDLTNLQLDLNLKAKKWRALHSTIRDNKLFYGDVLLSSNLHIKGPLSGVNVDGSVNVLKGTNFTLVLPDKNPEIESNNGIVVFVNKADSGRRRRLLAIKDTIKRVAISPGSDISVNVGVDPEAQFNVIIDQGTGDYVTVKGSASLNASVTPGGVIGLTGIYELKDGAYQLNYNFLKRKFNIKSGSTITFAGDPLDASLDITAVYISQAAPYDLVEKQVTDQSQLNYYKERLPFDVDLMLKGPIMQPAITFDIVLPENKNYRLSSSGVDLVRSRLTQIRNEPSEMNKQVFSLLLLNRFVGEDPFASGVGSSAEFAAKQSVGRFISDQLNNYASSLIKGVDLNVDLATQEDYTSGERSERTDLNISASKQLLNDRLTVTIGNNFELSGPQSSSDQNASLIPGNLAVDYRLTSDGRYTMRAYRTDQNTGALEGYVTETGLNFIVTLDYNRFKNLFNKKRRNREQQIRLQELKLQKQQTKDTTTANETK